MGSPPLDFESSASTSFTTIFTPPKRYDKRKENLMLKKILIIGTAIWRLFREADHPASVVDLGVAGTAVSP